MATKLSVTLCAFVIALASFPGSGFAEDLKSKYREGDGGMTESAASLQEKKAEAMRSGSSSESIQLRFGGGSGVTMGGSTGNTSSSSTTGAVMGNRMTLEGGEWRRPRGDGPPDHPRKGGGHPNAGHPRGDR